MTHANTTYKVFIAKTAANLFTEMVSRAIEKHEFNIWGAWKGHEEAFKHLASQATMAARTLGLELEDFWTCYGDKETLFFDTEDTLTTRIEGEIYDVGEKIAIQLSEMRKQIDENG